MRSAILSTSLSSPYFLSFSLSDIRLLFTPLTSVVPMANQGEEGNREDAKSARSSHDGRSDGSGEEAAGVRNGREARPFFDLKRGQLGANFSGGTGLTRPPEILTGAHIVAGPRFRREDRERHVGTIMVAGPHLPLPVDNVSHLGAASKPRLISKEPSRASISDYQATRRK